MASRSSHGAPRLSATPSREVDGQRGSGEVGPPSSERGDNDKNDDIEEEDEDIICAIDRRGRYLGCSVYTEAEQKLSLMEDIVFPDPEFISTRMKVPGRVYVASLNTHYQSLPKSILLFYYMHREWMIVWMIPSKDLVSSHSCSTSCKHLLNSS